MPQTAILDGMECCSAYLSHGMTLWAHRVRDRDEPLTCRNPHRIVFATEMTAVTCVGVLTWLLAGSRGGLPTTRVHIFWSDRISLQELDPSFSTVFLFLQTDTVVRRTDARKICLVRKS